MKTSTKQLFLLILFFSCFVSELNAQFRKICSSGIQITQDGNTTQYNVFGNLTYGASAASLPISLGQAITLTIDKVRHDFERDGIAPCGAGYTDKFYYRVYKQGSTAPAFTEVVLDGGGSDFGNCPPNPGFGTFRKFKDPLNLNVIGLISECGATYILEVKSSTFVTGGGNCQDETAVFSTTFTTGNFEVGSVCYGSLDAAMSAAAGNGTIYIYDDVTSTAALDIPVDLTLSFSADHVLINEATLTNDGSLIFDGSGKFINSSGGTYKGKGSVSGSVENNGTLRPGSNL